MTCKEFVVLDDVVKPKGVYWAESYNRKGKPVDAWSMWQQPTKWCRCW